MRKTKFINLFKYYEGKIIQFYNNKIEPRIENFLYFGKKYNSIEEYQNDHQICPNCFSDNLQNYDADRKRYIKISKFYEECLFCGWKGLNKDLLPNTTVGKSDNSDLNELLKLITEKYK